MGMSDYDWRAFLVPIGVMLFLGLMELIFIGCRLLWRRLRARARHGPAPWWDRRPPWWVGVVIAVGWIGLLIALG